MPNAGFSWGPNLSEIADAVWSRSVRQLSDVDNVKDAISDSVWTRTVRQLSDADNIKGAISDSVWTRSTRQLTNLSDSRASKIDRLDTNISTRATNSGVWNYSTRGLTEPVFNSIISANDTIRAEANTERSTNNSDYVKLKEFRVFAPGTVRLKWDHRAVATPEGVYSRVYVNGLAVSGEYFNDTSTYETVSCDVGVNDGDYVQLYTRTGKSGVTVYVRNCKLCYAVASGGINSPQVILD